VEEEEEEEARRRGQIPPEEAARRRRRSASGRLAPPFDMVVVIPRGWVSMWMGRCNLAGDFGDVCVQVESGRLLCCSSDGTPE